MGVDSSAALEYGPAVSVVVLGLVDRDRNKKAGWGVSLPGHDRAHEQALDPKSTWVYVFVETLHAQTTPTRNKGDHTPPVSGKVSTGERPVFLWNELRYDEAGKASRTAWTNSVAELLLPIEQRGALEEFDGLLHLPSKSRGLDLTLRALAVPIRLGPLALEFLLQELTAAAASGESRIDWLPRIVPQETTTSYPYPDEERYFKRPPRRPKSDPSSDWDPDTTELAIGAFDPMATARSRHAFLEVMLALMSRARAHPVRSCMKLTAEILVRTNRTGALDAKLCPRGNRWPAGEFQGQSQNPAEWLEEYEKRATQTMEDAERAAVFLAQWLMHLPAMWGFLRAAFEEQEDATQPEWAVFQAEVLRGLEQVPSGQALIRDAIQGVCPALGWVRDRVVPPRGDIAPLEGIVEGTTVKDAYTLGTKGFTAFLDAWRSVANVAVLLEALDPSDSIYALSEGLNEAAGDNVVGLQTTKVTTTLAGASGKAEKVALESEHLVERNGKLLKAMSDKGVGAETVAGVGVGLGLVNLGISINALVNSRGGDQREDAVVSLAGALVSTSSQFVSLVPQMAKLGEAAAKEGTEQAVTKGLARTCEKLSGGLAAFAAVIDMYTAYKSGKKAMVVGDYDQVAGHVLVGLGAAGSGVCALWVAAAGASAFPVAGWVVTGICTILAVGGTIIAALAADTPLELFSIHSFFGRDYRTVREAGFAWCGEKDGKTRRLGDWVDQFDVQQQVLLAVVCSFTVRYYGPQAVQIVTGPLLPDSAFVIEFDLTYEVTPGQTTRTYAPKQVLFGRPADGEPYLSVVYPGDHVDDDLKVTTEEGKTVFEVPARWPTKAPPSWTGQLEANATYRLVRSRCRVKLFLQGVKFDASGVVGTDPLPISGKWVDTTFWAEGGGDATPEVVSTDF